MHVCLIVTSVSSVNLEHKFTCVFVTTIYFLFLTIQKKLVTKTPVHLFTEVILLF